MKNKKQFRKNNLAPPILVASFFLFILAGFLYSKPFKVLKEVVAVGGSSVGELNLNASGTTFTKGGIWKSDGTVGIGTTDPGYKLHVSSGYAKTDTTLRTTAFIGSSEALASNPFGLRFSVVGAAANANRYVQLQTTEYSVVDSGNIVLQSAGGNVGIGTTSPGYKLDVAGGVKIDGASLCTVNCYFVSGSAGFRWNDSSLAYNNVIMYDNGNMYVRGNVGIGTVSPTAKLHVNGQAIFGSRTGAGSASSVINLNSDQYINFAFSTGYPNGDYHRIGVDRSIASGYPISYISTGADAQTNVMHLFRTGTTDSALAILENGNVGIGTVSPGYKVQVVGTVYASGSSRDYKQDIKNLEVDSSKIYDLQPVSYDYKKEYENLGYTLAGGRQFGLIAEDAYKVIPELVISLKDKKTANIDYQKLSVLLLAEMKNQKKEIDSLKSEVDNLKKDIEVIKQTLKINKK